VAGYAELIATLEGADFFIGVLPFVITYAVFFLTLRNSPKFGEDTPQARKMSILVSLAVGFLVSYFVMSTPAYQQFFIQYFGTLTIGLMGIMGLFVAFALTGLHNVVGGAYWWAIPVVILVTASFAVSGGFLPFIEGMMIFGFSVTTLAAMTINVLFDTGLIWLILILAVAGWTASEDKDDRKTLFEFLSQRAENSGQGRRRE
jgi:uncharacterized membrane protein YwzB